MKPLAISVMTLAVLVTACSNNSQTFDSQLEATHAMEDYIKSRGTSSEEYMGSKRESYVGPNPSYTRWKTNYEKSKARHNKQYDEAIFLCDKRKNWASSRFNDPGYSYLRELYKTIDKAKARDADAHRNCVKRAADQRNTWIGLAKRGEPEKDKTFYKYVPTPMTRNVDVVECTTEEKQYVCFDAKEAEGTYRYFRWR